VARPRLAEISDPPKFSRNRKELRHFISQLRIKLHGNAASFPTLQHRLSYAVGRLEGVAFGLVLPFIENDSVNLESIEALVQVLEDAFGDPDRIATSTVRCVQDSGAGVPPYSKERKKRKGKRVAS